jgi:hypothetical protein
MRPTKKLDPAKLRTRYDPPTIEEAVFAAEGLTGDPDQQVMIAAGLIGLPEDDIRSAVLEARMPAGARRVRAAGVERSVVVQRKAARTSLQVRR